MERGEDEASSHRVAVSRPPHPSMAEAYEVEVTYRYAAEVVVAVVVNVVVRVVVGAPIVVGVCDSVVARVVLVA